MKRPSVEDLKARALARAAAVQRVLASNDGQVVLEVMQDRVAELRAAVQPTGAPVDSGAALVAEGAQQQIDNLRFYADRAERTGTNG